jgi:hypothetical protein
MLSAFPIQVHGMLRHKTVFASLLALGLCTGPAHAGVYGDDLGKCLVESSSEQDKQQLVQWIFFAIALNPDIAPYATITHEQRTAADKGMARLFEKLVGETCAKQASAALKYEGPNAFGVSFELLGRVAGQEIFASPEVAAGTAKFTEQLDIPALQAKLGLKPEPTK